MQKPKSITKRVLIAWGVAVMMLIIIAIQSGLTVNAVGGILLLFGVITAFLNLQRQKPWYWISMGAGLLGIGTNFVDRGLSKDWMDVVPTILVTSVGVIAILLMTKRSDL